MDLVIELSTRFVNLPVDQVDSEIERSQRTICESLGLDRSSLWQPPVADPNALVLTHAYQRPGMPRVPRGMDAAPAIPWTLGQVQQGKLIAIARLDELPQEASVDRASLKQYGTGSTLVVPILVGKERWGALTFSSARERVEWPEEILNRCRLIADIFCSALARSRSDRNLRETEQRLCRSQAEVRELRDQLQEQNLHLRREVKQLAGAKRVIGTSRSFQNALVMAEQVAPTNSTVLLMGETGSGKGVIASRIHELSPRGDHPMVSVNCAAIPALLLESELFGREKGAYTGALSKQVGRFELANGSTLFLDEIGELPIELQVKLLRALEEKEIERLGSPKPIHINVRIIAATNRDLQRAMREGKFREDLYYRLSAFPISVPPLRERPEDIPLLVGAFVDEFAASFGKQIESISQAGIEGLQRYGWPGNVRELRNVVERAMIVARGPVLSITPPVDSRAAPAPSITIKSVEREHIRSVLDRVGGRIRGRNGAAEALGLKPTTLESRMAKLGISRHGRALRHNGETSDMSEHGSGRSGEKAEVSLPA